MKSQNHLRRKTNRNWLEISSSVWRSNPLLHPLVSFHSHRQFLLLIRISLYQYLWRCGTAVRLLSQLAGLAWLMRYACATMATRQLLKLRCKRHVRHRLYCDVRDTSGDARYRESRIGINVSVPRQRIDGYGRRRNPLNRQFSTVDECQKTPS